MLCFQYVFGLYLHVLLHKAIFFVLTVKFKKIKIQFKIYFGLVLFRYHSRRCICHKNKLKMFLKMIFHNVHISRDFVQCP